MRYRISLLIAASAILAAGCFQQAALIELNADGSGRLLIRVLVEKRYTQNRSDADVAKVVGRSNQERLTAYAEELGQGVRFVSVDVVENQSGWVGAQAVFEFDDIEQLHLPVDFTKIIAADLGEPQQNRDADNNRFSEDTYRFSFTPGTTSVFSARVEAPTSDEPPSVPDDPFADAGIDLPDTPSAPPGTDIMSAMAIGLIKPSLKNARISTAVRLPGVITETSAPSQPNNTSVLLLDMQIGEMAQSAAFDKAVQEQWRLETLLQESVAGIKGVKRGESVETTYRSQ